MNFLKLSAGLVFNLFGLLVLYKAIRTTRLKGIGEGFVDIIIAVGFIIIGLLVWTGYISG
jgi:putative Ca2+/H+ antiporter (TMEM165/GDT1 family)